MAGGFLIDLTQIQHVPLHHAPLATRVFSTTLQ